MGKWDQFRAFYPKLRICMPTNAICFGFSEVKKEISLKQMFYRLFDTNFGKSLISWHFCIATSFGHKWLKKVFSIISAHEYFPDITRYSVWCSLKFYQTK